MYNSFIKIHEIITGRLIYLAFILRRLFFSPLRLLFSSFCVSNGQLAILFDILATSAHPIRIHLYIHTSTYITVLSPKTQRKCTSVRHNSSSRFFFGRYTTRLIGLLCCCIYITTKLKKIPWFMGCFVLYTILLLTQPQSAFNTFPIPKLLKKCPSVALPYRTRLKKVKLLHSPKQNGHYYWLTDRVQLSSE